MRGSMIVYRENLKKFTKKTTRTWIRSQRIYKVYNKIIYKINHF